MAKLVIVRVPAKDGIPAHNEQMLPEEASRFWETQEQRFRDEQTRRAKGIKESHQIPMGSGVLLTSESPAMRAAVEAMGLEIAGNISEVLPFDRTLIWDPAALLRLDLVPAGLRFLDRWQVAAPLWSYEELARDIGTEEDRETTKQVIRDLRVPVYDTRAIFIRRCADTERLLETWREEALYAADGDYRLSFLRALYRVKPLLLALPMTWVNRQ